MRIFNDKKKMYIIGGVTAAVLVLALVLVIVLSGGKTKRYDKYYASAEAAYLDRDYEKTVKYLEKALSVEHTEQAYVLMASAYCAMDDEDMAIQVLYLGYSRVGGSTISDMLEELKAGGDVTSPDLNPDGDTLHIAGQDVSVTATSLVLAGKGVTAADMEEISKLENLDSLSISSNSISDLSPLSKLKNLTFLQISGNNISDLRPIASLPKLKTLYMDDNPVTDFEQLKAMTSLRTLSMKGIDISAEALSELQEALPDCGIYCDVTEGAGDVEQVTIGGKTFYSDVTELDLGNMELADISALAKCTNLVKLDLRNNSIKDVSALKDMQSLEWLCLWNNEVEDILPLMTLKNLEYADFDNNNIKNIAALEYMTGLRELWINGNPVTSIEPLKNMTELTRLGLKNLDLSNEDLSLLHGLTNLKELSLEGNTLSKLAFDELQKALPGCTIAHSELKTTIMLGDKEFEANATEISAVSCGVTELEGLEEFTELVSLNLTGNSISSITALQGLTKLQTLNLYGNIISNISPLSGLTSLKTLNLQNNLLTDISALSGCRSLEKLSLSGNRISTLTALSSCTALTELDLDNNSISDLKPLAALTSLKSLNLENNDITDCTALLSLTNLEVLNLNGNNISSEQIELLSSMLPRCYIITSDPLPASGSSNDDYMGVMP